MLNPMKSKNDKEFEISKCTNETLQSLVKSMCSKTENRVQTKELLNKLKIDSTNDPISQMGSVLMHMQNQAPKSEI
jgi:hypothetical protein